jgi:predicted GIY-YIG superfamily endonuclease
LVSKEPQFWAYVLENVKGVFYVGHTDDLDRRLTEHNDSTAAGSKFAPKNGPWNLVWSEAFPTRSAAMQREQQIKRMKSAKWIRQNLLNR